MNRVAVTGLGVVAPNGINVPSFTHAIKNGISGLHFMQELKDYAMGCCVAGVPADFDANVLSKYLTPGVFKSLRSSNIKYALAAAIEAWEDAWLSVTNGNAQPDTGCLFGNGVCDVDHMRYAIDMFEKLEVQRLGVRHIEQLMTSGASAYIGGLLGLGNQVTANSSACSTGTESVIMAYEKIKSGNATRMVAGSCEASSKYIWAVFDAMRVLNRNYNGDPAAASRPMSADSAGFVPGSGAGALILEEMGMAIERGATIYAEIAGGFVNSGGQRNGGTMTAPSSPAVIRCIETAVQKSGIHPDEIDLICGHLTGTFADKTEIANWAQALNRHSDSFPYINSLKSLTGHCISATGSIECVAAILQMHHNFIQPNINCKTIQPEILNIISEKCIVREPMDKKINTVIKANFGFGDVNSCIIFKKYKP
ncbi:MAG TPA: beta-ketoacyl-[acyl-carrier-protein] synthase family protein [Chitinophagaceae bacterium]|nr:beta-ketoacyl-[acyl-carrier-protein] synthase family protein [Chitinophagaceae bacterium]